MSITNVIFYIIAFLSLYVQVFFFLTFIENKKKLVFRKKEITLKNYPRVAIIVPCWNEEKTIKGTIESLLELNYPKDKIEIVLIDDGSTDNTFSVMKEYESRENIKVITKENGGKHTATNLGIQMTDTPYVGCLDADSFVHKEALSRMLSYFEAHPDTMAVSPSIIIHNPKTFIQKLQKIEYDWAIFIKKMLGIVGGIHVTPGPLSIYKREVFEKIGPFRQAHNTEDMEIAFRMQVNHMRIRQCNDAYIYTVGPRTIPALYRQRLRWIFGFIQNTIAYRKYMFKPKFGVFAIFTVPSGFISLIAAPFLLYLALIRVVTFSIEKINYVSVVGAKELFTIKTNYSFDWFDVPSTPILYITLTIYLFIIVGIFIGRGMEKNEGKKAWPIYQIIPFFITYSLIAPFWIIKAIWSSIIRRQVKWR
jgi:cellulose synthase/poly-beta-1,6-N-acetylglucosamine synthase-like glycosyltransferase